jgi:predicted nucleic acid-binding Zn ribbon protein
MLNGMFGADETAEFAARRQRESRRHYARRPKRIGDVLAELITTRGYGRIEADRQLRAAWEAAAGEPLARSSRAGRLRRGKLEVTVANSTIMQELAFQKREILARLQEQLPDATIRDIRFRLGAIP